MDFAFSLAGLVVGIAVGATGVGGGSLMTPILILFYGISPSVAVGTDLIYASISKAFGVTLHSHNGSVDWKLVGWMSLGSVPAALLTLVFLHEQPAGKDLDHLIKLTLSIAIVVTALFTIFQERLMALIRRSPREAEAIESSTWQTPLTVICGVVIGALVTISSVGAGAIGMMVLLLLYPKHAPVRLVGSDLAHAVLITAIDGAGHASLGTVNWPMLWSLLVGAIPGIYIGTRIGFRLQARALKRVISGLLIFVGATMLWKAIQ
jgi:uncharacterized membrane protein YfcA